MKLMLKLMLTLLVLAVVLPFTPLMPGGKPLMALSDIRWPDIEMPRLPGIDVPSLPEETGRTQLFYRWKDAEGNIHFSDKAPKGRVDDLSTVEVYPDANLLPAVDVKPAEKAAPVEKQPVTPKKQEAEHPYSPETVKKLFDDVNQIKTQAEKRNQALREIVGERGK